MAKPQQQMRAREMRQAGKSVKKIAQTLHVSTSSVSVWCKNIQLTSSQIDALCLQMLAGNYLGRMKGARIQKQRKEERLQNYRTEGALKIGRVSNRDLLLIGLGLYLGEGAKSRNSFQFTNSNPQLIQLVSVWLLRLFGVASDRLFLSVVVNKDHREREQEIRDYWSSITGVSSNNFRKTTFMKSSGRKFYESRNTYFGTLTMRVQKSSDLQYKILGLCHGVLKNGGALSEKVHHESKKIAL